MTEAFRLGFLSKVAVDSAASAAAGDSYEPPEDVKWFFDNIVPAIKSRGNDGVSSDQTYNKTLYTPGLYKKIPMFLRSVESDPGLQGGGAFGVNGYAKPTVREFGGAPESFGQVVLAKRPLNGDVPRTAVHELKHRQNWDGDLLWRWAQALNPFNKNRVWLKEQSGRSAKDDRLLSEAYGFTKADAGDFYKGEQATTHAEHQFDIMRELAKSLGHLPSAAEYVDYVQNADADTLQRWRGLAVNGYQDAADDRIRPTAKDAVDLEEFPALSALMSPKQVRKTRWYRLAPEAFEPELEEGKYKYFQPKEMYRQYLNRTQRRFTNEQLEAFRRVLLEVARNNAGGDVVGRYGFETKRAAVTPDYDSVPEWILGLGLDTPKPQPVAAPPAHTPSKREREEARVWEDVNNRLAKNPPSPGVWAGIDREDRERIDRLRKKDLFPAEKYGGEPGFFFFTKGPMPITSYEHFNLALPESPVPYPDGVTDFWLRRYNPFRVVNGSGNLMYYDPKYKANVYRLDPFKGSYRDDDTSDAVHPWQKNAVRFGSTKDGLRAGIMQMQDRIKSGITPADLAAMYSDYDAGLASLRNGLDAGLDGNPSLGAAELGRLLHDRGLIREDDSDFAWDPNAGGWVWRDDPHSGDPIYEALRNRAEDLVANGSDFERTLSKLVTVGDDGRIVADGLDYGKIARAVLDQALGGDSSSITDDQIRAAIDDAKVPYRLSPQEESVMYERNGDRSMRQNVPDPDALNAEIDRLLAQAGGQVTTRANGPDEEPGPNAVADGAGSSTPWALGGAAAASALAVLLYLRSRRTKKRHNGTEGDTK